MRQRKEVQEMSRCGRLALASLFLAPILFASDDQALWREYGLINTQTARQGNLTVTTYKMKDLTGAVAAWEWLRPPEARACSLAPFCAQSGKRTVVSDYNYVIGFEGAKPAKAQVEAALKTLPDKRATSLPAILSFLPAQGLVPGSARYVLGPASLQAFAPELAGSRPGFEQGAEAQVAEYRSGKSGNLIRLALFYYATPEMARMHTAQFERIAGAHVKRSGVLVAVVSGSASNEEAADLLNRVRYEANVIWDEVLPPSPIKPLYQLLLNILYFSILLSAICLAAGLMYAGMRIYRRRYGTLDADEAMTTLHLSGN